MAALIRDSVALAVREIPQPKFGIISITDVDVSGDLSYATVFVAALKNPDEAVRSVEAMRPRIHELISAQTQTYRIPQLRFVRDDRAEKAERLEKLLDNS